MQLHTAHNFRPCKRKKKWHVFRPTNSLNVETQIILVYFYIDFCGVDMISLMSLKCAMIMRCWIIILLGEKKMQRKFRFFISNNIEY